MASELERAIAEVHAGTATELILEEQEINAAGATQLADALRTNTSVKELHLHDNSIGEAGATQLADALRINTSVEKLWLGFNSIGAEGATQLADALSTNTSVEKLNLVFNSIGAELVGRIEACSTRRRGRSARPTSRGGGGARC